MGPISNQQAYNLINHGIIYWLIHVSVSLDLSELMVTVLVVFTGNIVLCWNLKHRSFFFQNVILLPGAFHFACNNFMWNWSDTINIKSAFLILMIWDVIEYRCQSAE